MLVAAVAVLIKEQITQYVLQIVTRQTYDLTKDSGATTTCGERHRSSMKVDAVQPWLNMIASSLGVFY
jgi:hypothetical protein